MNERATTSSVPDVVNTSRGLVMSNNGSLNVTAKRCSECSKNLTDNDEHYPGSMGMCNGCYLALCAALYE